jgi:hypothetical protein
MSLQSAVAVVCWSWICRLGSIEIGALGPINTLSFDHGSGSPESQLALLPDINKPPVGRFLFSALLSVAPYCVPGGIRVVSGGRRLLADAQELRTAMHHRTTVGLRPRDGSTGQVSLERGQQDPPPSYTSVAQPASIHRSRCSSPAEAKATSICSRDSE